MEKIIQINLTESERALLTDVIEVSVCSIYAMKGQAWSEQEVLSLINVINHIGEVKELVEKINRDKLERMGYFNNKNKKES